MLNKYFFYFFSWFNKKVDIFGGVDEYCYYAPSVFVGFNLAVILYTVINVVSIVFIQSHEVYSIVTEVMDFLSVIMCITSFLYFRHNNKWNVIYKEIQNKSISQKYRYGFNCLLYIVLIYGLWFFSNDIIRVLNTGEGSSLAIYTVNVFNLTYW